MEWADVDWRIVVEAVCALAAWLLGNKHGKKKRSDEDG